MHNASSRTLTQTADRMKRGMLTTEQAIHAIEAEASNVERLERLHEAVKSKVRDIEGAMNPIVPKLTELSAMVDERPRRAVDGCEVNDEPVKVGEDKTPLRGRMSERIKPSGGTSAEANGSR